MTHITRNKNCQQSYCHTTPNFFSKPFIHNDSTTSDSFYHKNDNQVISPTHPLFTQETSLVSPQKEKNNAWQKHHKNLFPAHQQTPRVPVNKTSPTSQQHQHQPFPGIHTTIHSPQATNAKTYSPQSVNETEYQYAAQHSHQFEQQHKKFVWFSTAAIACSALSLIPLRGIFSFLVKITAMIAAIIFLILAIRHNRQLAQARENDKHTNSIVDKNIEIIQQTQRTAILQCDGLLSLIPDDY